MAPGSKRSSISSNMDKRSHTSGSTATCTPQQHTLQPTPTSTAPSPSTPTPPPQQQALQPSTAPSPSTHTSATDGNASTVRQRCVRGATIGKRTQNIISSRGGERLPVYVTEEMRVLCGKYATQAANEIGSQVRRLCPIVGFHPTWKLVPTGLKSAILQGVRDRSEAAKRKRDTPVDGYTVRSRLHTMGSKSYAAAITTEADKPNGKMSDFPARYKATKWMKDGRWVDPLCKDLYDRMEAMRMEAELAGRPPPTDEEYSMNVLGKTDYYLRGPCVDSRPSSLSSKSNLSSQKLLKVQSDLELIREQREADERRHQEEREANERRYQEEREAMAARCEALEREQKQRDEEAAACNEALQRQLSELRGMVMGGKVH